MKHPIVAALLGASFSSSAFAHGIAEPTGVPEALRATGEHAEFLMKAEGVQVYTCKKKADSEEFAWTFVAPEAALTEGGKAAGKHYAGPHWESPDGSKVKGAVKARSDGGAGNIPLLLLTGTSEGAGKFAGVSSIQRLATKGGVEPRTGCDASKAGTEVRIPYTADYYFYRK